MPCRSYPLLSLFVTLALFATDAPADERIGRIENGLVEFGPPHEMLTREAPPEALRTLSDRMAHYKIPGVSIALIDDFELAWLRGYGETRIGNGDDVNPETLFEAASTTKFLVGCLALRLVEQQKLDLDADVNTMLEAWKLPENEFTTKEKVTLRRLLTHQAGLNRPDGGFASEGGEPTLVQILNGVRPALNPPAQVIAVPGSGWNYSNFGYLVVQLLVEELTELPFPQVMEEALFTPLGMGSSTLRVPLAAELAMREAYPHDADGVAHGPELNPHAVANGGLMTTPNDLARFTIEFLLACQGKSEKLVSEATAHSMLEPQVDLGAMLGFPVQDGLSVFLCGEGPTLTFLHPGDNMPGASCFLLGMPAYGDGVVIMTNGAMGNMLALEIVYAIAQEYEWPTSQYAME